MDDKDLKALKDVVLAKPSVAARDRALHAAQLAFEDAGKKSTQKAKGNRGSGRLLSTFMQSTWEWTMARRIVVGTIAASIMLVPIGAHLIQTTGSPGVMEMFGVGRQEPGWSYFRRKNIELDSISGQAGKREVPVITLDDGARTHAESPLGGSEVAAIPTERKSSTGEVVHAAPTSGTKKAHLRVMKPARLQDLNSGNTGIYSRVGDLSVKSDGTVRPVPAPYAEQGRDKFEKFAPSPIKVVSEDPVSTFSIDVDTASYAFVRRMIERGSLPPRDAVRVEELINYFPYNYAYPDGAEAPFKPTIALYPTPWNPDTKLLHIGLKGYDVVSDEKPRSNLVFLIDVSGSMQSPDKLPLLKNAFRLLVDRLGDDDSVAIVTYAGQAGTVLEPTKVMEKHKIYAALDRLRSGGSTAGAQGIRQAYALAQASFEEDSVNRVILATDGDFNVGITDRGELKRYIETKRKSGVFLSVLGFGQGNYNDALMQALAQNGNGNAAYIDSLKEAQKVLVEEASSTLFPIAKDVKIQIEFNPALVAEYRLVGYETRALRREDFNNDKVDAGDIGSGHTVTAIYEITPTNGAKKQIDDLRYQTRSETVATTATEEYAFLKLRYKLPKESVSKLITVPITKEQEASDVLSLSSDLRFAASVAAFGQKLRSDSRLGDYGYDEIAKLASSARGDDPFGYRSEFVSLVRLAKTLSRSGAK